MQSEQVEIYQFLSTIAPFSLLSAASLEEVVGSVEVGYFKAGTQILSLGDAINDLCCVRSGAVEVFRKNGELYNRLSQGGVFGYQGLLVNRHVRYPVCALEDTLIYYISGTVFREMLDREEEFADFFAVEDSTRLLQVVSRQEKSSPLMTSKVSSLIGREPVTLLSSASVQQAAQLMCEEQVSSLLVLEPVTDDVDDDQLVPDLEAGPHYIRGILTDRDLRERIIAQGLSYETAIDEVMSQSVVTINSDDFVFEAMMAMLRSHVYHLPVLKKGRPLGVINLADIVRHESQSSLFIVSNILHQTTLEGLVALRDEVNSSFVRLVNEDANSQMIGTAMAIIGRTFKQRLIELAIETLGEPPIEFCFLALGSMARDEQLIVTDQDNALILDNSYDPQQHGSYFEQLAEYVCLGLAACGYALCTGGIMATNPVWRMTQAEWEVRFCDWIDNPTPRSLLDSSIFFDLDGVYGRTEWADQLNSLVARRAKRSQRFLASMARNALLRTPPLGFFRTFVLEQDGEHKNSINLKRRGTAPLVDLIRVHALAIGSSSRNSFERLDDIVEANILPLGRGEDIKGALEFIALVRIRHQKLDLEKEIPPDNNIEPESLSNFERRNLKDAFQIVSDAQKYLTFRYQPNRAN